MSNDTLPTFPASALSPEQLAAAWETNHENLEGEKAHRKAAGESSIDAGFNEITEYKIDAFGRKTLLKVTRVPILDVPLTPEQALETYTPLREKVQALIEADEDHAVEMQQASQLGNYMLGFIVAALDAYPPVDGTFNRDIPLSLILTMQDWAAWQNATQEMMAARAAGAPAHVYAHLYEQADDIHRELLAGVEYAIRELTGNLPVSA